MRKHRNAENANAESLIDSASLDGCLGFQLKRAQTQVFQRFVTVFSQHDLRPTEYCALILIGDNPGRKQSEIASILGIQRANFVALINELERRHLIERRNAPNDRRSNALHLTQKGTVFLADARRVEAQFESDCTALLGGQKGRDQLLALLAKLSQ